MSGVMAHGILTLINPWKRKRARIAAEIDALRRRDGEQCARCRRPLRFDLPAGHDQGARIEQAGTAPPVLTHGRCNLPGRDQTEEVMERLRPSREAALFAKSRKKRAA